MKKVLSLLVVIILGLTCSVYAGKKEDIADKAQSKTGNVFQEMKNGGQPSKGQADLVIKTSIKTYPDGHFAFESRPLNVYPFVLIVDGQGASWTVEGQKEATPYYDDKGKRLVEGGKGTRYVVERKIRLAPGAHKIFFGLPEEKFSTEVAISLNEGTENVIEFKPVYRNHRKSVRHFAHGLSEYEVFLNGNRVK